MGAEEGGVGGMSGVQVGRECGARRKGALGVCLGCGCGGRGASGGVSRCGWGCVEGVSVGASRVWLWVHWGSVWGADLVRMSAPGSFWGLDGTEVLCFRRWEEVRGCGDDRMLGFPCVA